MLDIIGYTLLAILVVQTTWLLAVIVLFTADVIHYIRHPSDKPAWLRKLWSIVFLNQFK